MPRPCSPNSATRTSSNSRQAELKEVKYQGRAEEPGADRAVGC